MRFQMHAKGNEAMGPLTNWRHWLLLSLLLVMLAGCAVKFVYNRLDWLVPWYLDDYLELNNQQEKGFETQLQGYLSWHRQSQLPLYAGFLNQVAERFTKGMAAEDITFIETRTQTLRDNLVERLLPEMIQLFQKIDDAQIAALFAKFHEDNQKFWDEAQAQTPQEQKEQRAEAIQDYVERWTGRLNKTQRQIIAQGIESYQFMDRELLIARRTWQQRFRQTLQNRQQSQPFAQQMTALLTDKSFGQSAAFQRKYSHNEALLKGIYLQLDKSLSERQRQHAVANLRRYAQDFTELSREK